MGIPRNPLSIAHASREPVSCYNDGLGWLFRHTKPEAWILDHDVPLPDAARLLCDIFWIHERKLRSDMLRLWKLEEE